MGCSIKHIKSARLRQDRDATHSGATQVGKLSATDSLVGCQGLADTFILLGMPFDSDEATQLNKEIFECIYYAALETSNELAQKEGVDLTAFQLSC